MTNRKSAFRAVSMAWLLASGMVLHSSPCFAQSLDQFNDSVNQASAMSPAGGPKNNPTAVVFVSFRKSRTLCWVTDGKLQSAVIVPSREADDKKEGGPTPAGEYLIGKRYMHEKYKIDWCKLYPRMEDNSGYYSYTAKTKAGRFAMGLHPGSVSLGCVTVKSTENPYDQTATWKAIRQRLDSSKLKYKGDEFSGFLFVIDK